MRAALLRELPATSLVLADVPEPHPNRDDEVLVEVEACGICGTDLHILSGEAYRPDLPFVLGHEPIGNVLEAGVRAGEWIGRRVTTTLFEGCGCCAWCAEGHERLCPELRSILGVLGRPGAFAERFVVPAAQLVPVPDTLVSDQAAALVDAGATAMNAARIVLERDRHRIAITGGGPVGMLVAELLSHAGHSPVVVELSATRRQTIAARDYAVAETVDDLAGTFDCVVECSGSPQVPNRAFGKLEPRGLLVLAGYALVPELDFGPIARKELTVRGVRSGSRADLEDVLALASTQRIALPPIDDWALEDVNDALCALRGGTVNGKAVIHPNEGDIRQEAEPKWTSS